MLQFLGHHESTITSKSKIRVVLTYMIIKWQEKSLHGRYPLQEQDRDIEKKSDPSTVKDRKKKGLSQQLKIKDRSLDLTRYIFEKVYSKGP